MLTAEQYRDWGYPSKKARSGHRHKAASALPACYWGAHVPARKHSEVQPAGAELYGQLAGEYRIGRKLGSGGFGTVFEAEHPVLKRKAAVKVLHANPAVDSMAVQRFIEEARSASQIRHRHIVDIFSFGQLPDGHYFYVMDLLDGVPLDAYLREHGKLEPSVALPVLRPIASAIDALHAASIVHRDLKPANVFLAWDARGDVVPMLLDLGLVKLLDRASVHTESGVPMGTPFYMSPEQCQGGKLDGRADIYSLGVICFELLTGTPPFSGDSATAVLIAHVTQPPPRLTECRPELPSELDAPVASMLAKDPMARPSSALAALSELEAAARRAGMSIPEALPSLPRPKPKQAELEMQATVAQSGMRAGRAATAPKARWWWLALGPLVALGWYVGEHAVEPGQPSVAEEPITPQPSAAPQQPSAAAPPAEAPAPVAEPRTVSILVRGAPAGAELWLGEQQLGAAPGPVLVPYGELPVQLQVRVANRPPRTLEVTPNAAQELTLPAEKPARRRPNLPRDLENPF